MNASSGENDSCMEDAIILEQPKEHVLITTPQKHEIPSPDGFIVASSQEGRSQEEEEPTLSQSKNQIQGQKSCEDIESASEFGSLSDPIQLRVGSPTDSFLSIPDDSPSVQGSFVSSIGARSLPPSIASRSGIESPIPSFRPFDIRFQSRLPKPNPPGSKLLSLNPINHSRNVSLGSLALPHFEESGPLSTRWKVVRWTKLKKINTQVFCEVGKRNFGMPTCISVSASVALGTSKGIILIFDYQQNLKSIIGPGTKAVECGPLTSIAISADHLIVAGGHANGSIFTWEISRAARPFLYIPSLDSSQIVNRTLDGHTSNIAIRHLGFLGTRHTALVSADDCGMAFSHLATRGLGAVGRSVKTTRILGRYPNNTSASAKPRKPSTVFAFAPLPLGNVERGTDTLGLTAMLTPYLLVIVSTTPVAQTQYKIAKPKDLDVQSSLAGCLAWFPGVRLRVPDPITGREFSKVKLVYCWSNILTVLDIDEVESPDRPLSLSFESRSRWESEEAIVAVQWLSRSILTILTVTQRLIILEDGIMRVIETFDLIHKHIYHQDIFSKQLHSFVEYSNEDETPLYSLIADAFYMSFKAYKSRIFLLGFDDVSIGTLSNWAEHFIAMVEDGDYVKAISLATSYYTGNADKLFIGLPEDTGLRHSMVGDKLVELVRASLKCAFNQTHNQNPADVIMRKNLAEASIEACISMKNFGFLFEEVFECYEDGQSRGIFFEALEPQILENHITLIPIVVVKSMVTHFVSQGLESRLDQIICHIEPSSLDIDQVTNLCKQLNLYDALISVWTRALNDYITPLVELLGLLMSLIQNGNYMVNENALENHFIRVNAFKIFPYMSYTFAGRVYPTGEYLDEQKARTSKTELYWFLFSGKTITWPQTTGIMILIQPSQENEPSFPYLRMILKFDAPSFLGVLNEAFEDSFLNESPERAVSNHNLPEEAFNISVNRQYIISVLLEVMNPDEFATGDIIYLNMFIARNLPKFPQFLLLSSATLRKVLTGLCQYPGPEIADDAQLSAEYLLSVYRPSNLPSFLSLFQRVGFYRVLKGIYKSEGQYSKLLQAYFDDPNDQTSIFDCISSCLRPRSGLTRRQIKEVHDEIVAHAVDLVRLNATQTAQTIDSYASDLHKTFIDCLAEEPELMYIYLRTFFELETSDGERSKLLSDADFTEKYVQLMCKYDPSDVAAFVETVQVSHLNLDEVLPFMEESGVIDAAVMLMSKNDRSTEAMSRLTKHMKRLEGTLLGLFSSSVEKSQINERRDCNKNLLDTFQKYTNVGIWLCKSQTKRSSCIVEPPIKRKSLSISESSPEEILWLDLIDVTVQITRSLLTRYESLSEPDSLHSQHDMSLAQIRAPVQSAFTALLASTATSTSSDTRFSFIRILQAFLTRASVSSPSLSDLRAVLASVFSAYTYEENILTLANRLLEKNLFGNVQSAMRLRQRGWKPCKSTCQGCGRRIWGPGISGDVYAIWEEREEIDIQRRRERRNELAGSYVERGKGRARPQHSGKVTPGLEIKELSVNVNLDDDETETRSRRVEQTNLKQPDFGPLLVLACGHTYHQSCLEKMQGEESADLKCPIDG